MCAAARCVVAHRARTGAQCTCGVCVQCAQHRLGVAWCNCAHNIGDINVGTVRQTTDKCVCICGNGGGAACAGRRRLVAKRVGVDSVAARRFDARRAAALSVAPTTAGQRAALAARTRQVRQRLARRSREAASTSRRRGQWHLASTVSYFCCHTRVAALLCLAFVERGHRRLGVCRTHVARASRRTRSGRICAAVERGVPMKLFLH